MSSSRSKSTIPRSPALRISGSEVHQTSHRRFDSLAPVRFFNRTYGVLRMDVAFLGGAALYLRPYRTALLPFLGMRFPPFRLDFFPKCLATAILIPLERPMALAPQRRTQMGTQDPKDNWTSGEDQQAVQNCAVWNGAPREL